MSILRERLRKAIASSVSLLNVRGKCGRDILQPAIAEKLNAAGFIADLEDSRSLLGSGLAVWRSKDNGEIEPTRARRLVDIVVYDQDKLVALIETESDLDDLRATGVTNRNRHYDVWSIAKSQSGQFFDSYKSLERMAATAFYASLPARPTPEDAVAKLTALRSSQPSDHNPLAIHLFLVSGRCRPIDHTILAPRLKSLDAELMCVRR